MKLCWKVFLISVISVMLTPSFTFANFLLSASRECAVDTDGINTLYLCGAQTRSCNGKTAKLKNTNWYYDHPGAEADKAKNNGTNYWCCGGTTEKAGVFVSGDNWIKETKSVTTEAVPGRKCTWVQKINVCGEVDNPEDEFDETKCTEVACTQGYVSHNKKCVKACSDGYGFESETSENCISCPTTSEQSVVGDICVKCGAGQLFDTNLRACVEKSSRLLVSVMAYDSCWECVTPGAMYECMKTISTGKSLPANLQKSCSASATETDAAQFSLPDVFNVAQTPQVDVTNGTVVDINTTNIATIN